MLLVGAIIAFLMFKKSKNGSANQRSAQSTTSPQKSNDNNNSSYTVPDAPDNLYGGFVANQESSDYALPGPPQSIYAWTINIIFFLKKNALHTKLTKKHGYW